MNQNSGVFCKAVEEREKAEKLKKEGEDRERYVESLVLAEFETADPDIRNKLDDRHQNFDRTELNRFLGRCDEVYNEKYPATTDVAGTEENSESGHSEEKS